MVREKRVLFGGGPYPIEHRINPETGDLEFRYRGQEFKIEKSELIEGNEDRVRQVVKTWTNTVDRGKEIKV